MLGFLIKDLRTNRKWVILVLLVVIFMNGFTQIPLVLGQKDTDSLFMIGVITMFAFCSFICTGAFAMNFVQTDERKKWGYYVVSIPRGVEKQIASKYIFVALSLLIPFVICCVSNAVCRYFVSGVPKIFGIMLCLLGVELIMKAVEMPCIIALGSKMGTMVKGGLMALLMLAAVIYGLFGDLSWLGSEDSFWNSFFRFLSDFNASSLGYKLLIAAVPLFTISGVISVKLYLKGVERMEK